MGGFYSIEGIASQFAILHVLNLLYSQGLPLSLLYPHGFFLLSSQVSSCVFVTSCLCYTDERAGNGKAEPSRTRKGLDIKANRMTVAKLRYWIVYCLLSY